MPDPVLLRTEATAAHLNRPQPADRADDRRKVLQMLARHTHDTHGREDVPLTKIAAHLGHDLNSNELVDVMLPLLLESVVTYHPAEARPLRVRLKGT